jgi:hypothetical protein
LRNINRISPPTSSIAGKQKKKLPTLDTLESLFSKQLKEVEIMLYTELWDNGKRVITWMLGGGGV